jgi:signal transduction histidine kinase
MMTEPGFSTPSDTPLTLPPLPGRPTAAEQQMLNQFDAGRRLALLRIIVPGLLVVTVLGVAFSIQTDLASENVSSSLQAGAGLVCFTVALWATWKRYVNTASFALFAGIAAVIILLLLNDAIQTPLDVATLPEFELLLLPILVAAIFGGPSLTVLTTAATSLFTFGLVYFSHHTPALDTVLRASNGPAVYTIPIALQFTSGTLLFAATRGFRRTQRELGDIRLAYAREKELEHLKDQFISSINHELRTPIMALQGYIEIAQELGARGETQRQTQILERSAGAADHLATLVKGTLSVSRIEADAAQANLTTFTLAPAILAAIELLDPREAGDRERELRLDVPPDVTVVADQDHVRQVMLNLLSNASKYSPAGSSIEIAAHILPPALSNRRNGKAATRQMVEVRVRDHGLGIPPEQIPLLFQRFVRLERDLASSVSGTGLGLAICKSYIQAMGGTIWIESNGISGDGSSVIFTLPLGSPADVADSLA